MKDTTKKMIDNEIINRMHYVINCDEDRKFQDNIRRDHYHYLSGFVSSLFHNGNMSQDEYRHYSNLIWDMYGDRQTEAENNLTSMDSYGRAAILSDGDNIYYYYNTEDGEILRVSDTNEASRNPSWDMDLLSEDLAKDDTEIVFLCDDMIAFILETQDAIDMYDDKYMAVAEKVKEYKAATRC